MKPEIPPTLDDMTRAHLAYVDELEASDDLTAEAAGYLRERMLAGDDTYPFHSGDRTRWWIWEAQRRHCYTPDEYNAYISARGICERCGHTTRACDLRQLAADGVDWLACPDCHTAYERFRVTQARTEGHA